MKLNINIVYDKIKQKKKSIFFASILWKEANGRKEKGGKKKIRWGIENNPCIFESSMIIISQSFAKLFLILILIFFKC